MKHIKRPYMAIIFKKNEGVNSEKTCGNIGGILCHHLLDNLIIVAALRISCSCGSLTIIKRLLYQQRPSLAPIMSALAETSSSFLSLACAISAAAEITLGCSRRKANHRNDRYN